MVTMIAVSIVTDIQLCLQKRAKNAGSMLKQQQVWNLVL